MLYRKTKIIVNFLLIGLLSSCTTYEKLNSRDESELKYSINCSGGLLTIESCKNTSSSLCLNGYEELSRTDAPNSININRNMTIQCK